MKGQINTTNDYTIHCLIGKLIGHRLSYASFKLKIEFEAFFSTLCYAMFTPHANKLFNSSK